MGRHENNLANSFSQLFASLPRCSWLVKKMYKSQKFKCLF